MSRAPTWISESVKKNKIEKEKICIYAPIALVIHLDEMSIANLIVCLEACQRHAEQESEKLRENKRGEREEGIGKVRIKTKKLNEWGYSFRCAWNSCRRSAVGRPSFSVSLPPDIYFSKRNKQTKEQINDTILMRMDYENRRAAQEKITPVSSSVSAVLQPRRRGGHVVVGCTEAAPSVIIISGDECRALQVGADHHVCHCSEKGGKAAESVNMSEWMT